MKHTIRLAKPSDGEAILHIYEPYISQTTITFEVSIPTVEEFSDRIKNIGENYPFIVWETDGKICGYAYASKHRERAAYCYDVDVSIYVSAEYQGSGIAGKLYGCLFEILKELGYYNAYAGYTVPNEKSRIFHEKFGFETIGVFRKTGYKFGKWHDVVWMAKAINDHDIKPGGIKSIRELPEEQLKSILSSYSGLMTGI